MAVIFHMGLRPEKAHSDDAAYDLTACTSEPIVIEPGDRKLIPTGFWGIIPEGFVGLICSRSGMALVRGLFVLNAPGVIDPSYRGEVGVVLANIGKHHEVINPGERIAQLLIVRTSVTQFVHDPAIFDNNQTARGSKGYGSTGRSKPYRQEGHTSFPLTDTNPFAPTT